MASLHHICSECSSEFTIKYDDEQTESDPIHCPFCGEYLIEAEDFGEELFTDIFSARWIVRNEIDHAESIAYLIFCKLLWCIMKIPSHSSSSSFTSSFSSIYDEQKGQ